jgi:hypothetical protein
MKKLITECAGVLMEASPAREFPKNSPPDFIAALGDEKAKSAMKSHGITPHDLKTGTFVKSHAWGYPTLITARHMLYVLTPEEVKKSGIGYDTNEEMFPLSDKKILVVYTS